MNPENALELLGPPIRGKRSISCSPLVRKYAVFRLKQASDQELELYLLQLVQVTFSLSTALWTVRLKSNRDTLNYF